MYSEWVAGTFDNLVRVGIVEREVTFVLALDESSGDGKVVETTIHLTLMKGRRDADGTIDLDTRRPETIIKMYLRERHLLDLCLSYSRKTDACNPDNG